MIAVSTIRPFGDDPVYKANQLMALSSWLNVFDKVIYVNKPEREIDDRKVFFVPLNEEFPTLKSLAWIAAFQYEETALINGDIVVTEPLTRIPGIMRREYVWAVTSKRYQFDPAKQDLSQAVVEDNGADFFLAQPNMWKYVSNQAPVNLRFGQDMWDHWLLGFFNVMLGKQFRNITDYRCIYHPKHEGRKRVPTDKPNDPYFNAANWPRSLEL